MADQPGTIARIAAPELRNRCDEYAALLDDAVADGASVGFLVPGAASAISSFWQEVAADLETGTRVLLAFERDGSLQGTVQIAFCGKPNGRHRAEIQKLLVYRSARRQGIGAALMNAAEDVAREHGCWLLMLDTREGAPSDALYRRLGWTAFGRVADYARDPDGALAPCVFFTKRLVTAKP